MKRGILTDSRPKARTFEALLKLFARMHTQLGIVSLCVPYSVFRDLEIPLRRITAIRGVPKGPILKLLESIWP